MFKMLRHTIRTRPLFKPYLDLDNHHLSLHQSPSVLQVFHFTLASNTHLISIQSQIPSNNMNPYPPKGTIVYGSVGRPQYGFDIFCVNLLHPPHQLTTDHRLTDCISINFNAQFVEDHRTLVFVSERTGYSRNYLLRPESLKPQALPSAPGSLFHDRPTIKNGRIYFTSAHEKPDCHLKSYSAVYSTGLHGEEFTRLTPYGEVDFSPAVSQTAKFIAVASYGSRPWAGDFHELKTHLIVFPQCNPQKRLVVSERGGWPTWCGDSTIYYHRQADDGWWSIFRVDLPDSELSGSPKQAVRVTPSGVHCFTPAAMHDGRRIAVATRRRGTNFRHIEIFDMETNTFQPITELINPKIHHYNPFVSPNSDYLGYHRFRGESSQDGESIIPHLEPVQSPVQGMRLLRLNGYFPTFSPHADLIAFNHNLNTSLGMRIIKSDGSKRWTLFEGRISFYNSWSPTEKHVIYTSIGPIFAASKTTVQIARITFDPATLTNDREHIPCDIKILTRDNTGNNAFPSCSPDGKSVVFRSGRSGNKNLYIIDAVEGEVNGSIRQLTDGAWIDTMPCWSPKGDLIAFSSNRHNPENTEAFSIYVVKPDGSGLRRIYIAGKEGSEEVERERINHVCFSEDGEWLLFTANLGSVTAEPVSWPNQFQPYGDLYVAKLDGSGVRRLTCDAYENGTPMWHSGNEVDMGRLCLSLRDGGGDKVKGEFDEPLWI
ncbi:TolB protein-related isoform 1 [Senna tora]|uniref:TolB protein-related isoform 1 n=1 Tax=Senna tora TaxID=362788 RepID=A0A834WIB1_9FABA|nr:TolB protein-related isoform 1 [Senna tora]